MVVALIIALCVLGFFSLGYLLFISSAKLKQIKNQVLEVQNELTLANEINKKHATEIGILKQEIDRNILHDPLTGLLSRSLFEDRLVQVFHQCKRHKLLFSILFLDLDGFNVINEALGHAAGNDLLKEVAKRLVPCIRQLDTISRFEGDKFVFILPQISKAETVAYVCQRLLEAISRPFNISNQILYMTASIGVSVYPTDGDEYNLLLKNAETALHQAKAKGRNHYQFYREEMQASSHRELVLSSGLQSEHIFQQLSIFYQPLVHVKTQKIICMEALLRWNHPDLGLIQPREFLRLIELSGKMEDIGEWVLLNACKRFKQWHAEGFAPNHISVNISLKQLEHPHFTYKVAQILRELSIDPASLILEISEMNILPQIDLIEKTLHMLKHLGVQIAIDDFGTGALSLHHLRKFPINYLKIDSSLTQDITINKEDEAVANMIISLAKSLHLQVIAEGVETHKQKQRLGELGCEIMQGHLFSVPLKGEEFTEASIKSVREII